MLTDEQARQELQKMLDVCDQDNNHNTLYLLGIRNGLECALAMVEGREPRFRRTSQPAGEIIDTWLEQKRAEVEATAFPMGN